MLDDQEIRRERIKAFNFPLIEQIVNDILSQELDLFLAMKKDEDCEVNSQNKRNGYYYRTFKTDLDHELHIQVPRDRFGAFHAHLLPKKQSIQFADDALLYHYFLHPCDYDTLQERLHQWYGEDYPEDVFNSLATLIRDGLAEYYQQQNIEF